MRTSTWKLGIAIIGGAGLLLSVTAQAAHAQDAKADFEKNCKSCHGVAGKGDGPAAKALKPPPGDFATSLKGKSDADITKLLTEGGKPVGKNHPAFGKKFNEEQIKGLAAYVKELAAK